jgi:hypothetical protein
MIEPDRQAPILPWHMVAGAFLHLVMPFYLLALLEPRLRACRARRR